MSKNAFSQPLISVASGAVGAALTLIIALLVGVNFFPMDIKTDVTSPPSIDQIPTDTAIYIPSEPSLEAWDNHITATIAKVQPAVVSIAVTKDLPKYRTQARDPFYGGFFDDPFFDQFFGRVPQGRQESDLELETERTHVGGGSGFLVSSDGIVVTNRHVINDESAEYTVITLDGSEFEAKVLARDPFFDLAYLKIEPKDGNEFPYLDFADSDQIKLGQSVLAIGNALDEFRNTVTRGIVSGLNRKLMAGTGYGSAEIIEQAIQTDAAINPGNSGGPLLNINGQVIGVNTAVSLQGQLIGFALPSNLVKRGLDQVKTTGKISRAWLGIRYQLITDDLIKKNNLKVDHGALILRGADPTELAVMPGSPADKAGLRENDIILEINGQKITEERSLASIIATLYPGDTAELKISRAGEDQTITVTLEERE
jgi:serine protease Do